MTLTAVPKRRLSTPPPRAAEKRTLVGWLMSREVLPDLAALHRLRLICLSFALLNCVVVLPIIFLRSGSSVVLRIAALTAIAILGWRWIHGSQNQSFAWPLLDVVESAALLAVGLAVGRPENAIGFFYAAVMYRSLYGSRGRSTLRVLMFLGAFATIVLASSSQAVVSDLLAPIFGLLFTAMVARVIAETLRSHSRALKRERILRQLGGMLGRFRDEATMRVSVLAALHALIGEDSTARTGIARGNAEEMTFVAAEGDHADSIRESHVVLSRFPPTLVEELQANHVIRPITVHAALVAPAYVAKTYMVAAPLIMSGDLIGMLTLASDRVLAPDLDDVLPILASQVSMWLEGQQADSLLREKDRERASLLRHLVLAQEDERKIIAGDIHDDSIQEMAAVAIRLGMLRRHLADAGALETLTKVEDSVTSSIGRLRSLMFSLRPPALDDDGLAAALRQQLGATAEECDFNWDLTSDLPMEPPIEVRVPAFRIAQEAIANVRKHAEARNVTIAITTKGGGVQVRVRDDGVGFSRDRQTQQIGHLGVTSMRERAEISGGTYSITSAPGEGTTVEFWIPNSLTDLDAPA